MLPNQNAGIQAVFMIPPKVHLLDITGPAHVFYEAACYGAPVKLLFCSIDPRKTEAESSSLLSFYNLSTYDDLNLKSGDLVFVPGLEADLLLTPTFLAATKAFQYWLKKQHAQGVIICSVCTGAFLLAAAGLLDNRRCTTHWKYTERFKALYPGTRLEKNRLFVREENIYTSAGVSSGIDLALYLIEELWGPRFTAQIAKEVVIYFRRTIDDPQLNIFTQYRNHLDDRIHQAQDLLSQSINQKLSIEELAGRVNMSARNLTRGFKNSTGITIGNYLAKLRMEQAGLLLAEGHSLQAVALQCGLKSVNSLKKLLRPH